MSASSSESATRAKRLNRTSWLAYLEVILWQAPDSSTRVGGRRLNSAQTRALYRWRHEQVSPTLIGADRFLIAFEISVNDFFNFCEAENLPAWST